MGALSLVPQHVFSMAVQPEEENTATTKETDADENKLFPDVALKEEDDTAEKEELQNTDFILKTTADDEGVYFFADKYLSLTKQVSSDAYVAGNTVRVANRVGGDLFAAGNTVQLGSPVDGSIRLAGSDVTVDCEVGKNALIFGQTVRITSNAVINGHANIYANTIIIEGAIHGNTTLRGQNIHINGTLNQKVNITGDTVRIDGGAELQSQDYSVTVVSTYLTINPKADGTKKIYYSAPSHKNTVQKKQAQQTERFNHFMISTLVFGLLGILIIMLWPQRVERVEETLNTKIKESWMKGFLFLILTPFLAIILFGTIIGIPFSLLLMVFYFAVLALGRMAVGLWLGRHVVHTKKLNNPKHHQVLRFIIGYFILSVLMSLQWIGWLFCLAAAVWGAGAIIASRSRKQDRRSAAPLAAEAPARATTTAKPKKATTRKRSTRKKPTKPASA